MLDLIGFWGNATVLTVVLLSPWSIIAWLWAVLCTDLITEDKKYSNGMWKWLRNRVITKDAPDSWDKEYVYSFLGGRVHVENEENLVGPFFIVVFVSAILHIAFLVGYNHNNWADVVEMVSRWSTYLAPYTAYVFVTVLSSVSFVYLGRKVFRMGVKVNAVLEKAED